MRAYKYTNTKYCKPWSFRLGTLYDYRDEETLGSEIGDKSEGSFQLVYTTENTIDDLEFEDQSFPFVYVKGDRDGKNFYGFTISNLLVYSAVLNRNDDLYQSFEESDCCVSIKNFESFAKKLMKEIKEPIISWKISKCIYAPKNLTDHQGKIPDIAFLKGEEYKHQEEIRLCIMLARDPISPIILSGQGFWKHCQIIGKR